MFQLGNKLRKTHFYRITSVWQEMKAFKPVISRTTGSWIAIASHLVINFSVFLCRFYPEILHLEGRKDKIKTGIFDTNHENRQGLDWRQSRSLTPNTYLPTAFPSQLASVRLQVVPIPDSRASETRARVKITPREKGKTQRSLTIPEEKWGLLVVYKSVC